MTEDFRAVVVLGPYRIEAVNAPTREAIERKVKAFRYMPGFVFAAIYERGQLCKRYARGLKGSPQ